MQSNLEKWETIIRFILIIGSLVSIGALIADTQYLKSFAIVSALSGLVSTVILPSLGWNEKVKNVNEVRCRWLELEKQVNGLWNDEESGNKVPQTHIKKCDVMHTEIAKVKVKCKLNKKALKQVSEDMKPYYPKA